MLQLGDHLSEPAGYTGHERVEWHIAKGDLCLVCMIQCRLVAVPGDSVEKPSKFRLDEMAWHKMNIWIQSFALHLCM